jgi:hypothetical protein
MPSDSFDVEGVKCSGSTMYVEKTPSGPIMASVVVVVAPSPESAVVVVSPGAAVVVVSSAPSPQATRINVNTAKTAINRSQPLLVDFMWIPPLVLSCRDRGQECRL